MAITNASTLAEYASGIGTQNSTLTVDSGNKRVGVGTTNPLGTFQVGSGVTFWGDAGIGSFTSLKLSGDTDSTSISTGALTVTGGVGIGLSLTVGGDVSVGGTITYEDVTNVDSLGIVTARSGLRVVGGGITCVGVATFFNDIQVGDKIIHNGDTNTAIRFADADTITAETGGSERFRIDSSGRVLIGTTTEGATEADELTVATSGHTGLTLRSGSTNRGNIYFSDATSGDAEYDGWISYDHNTRALRLATATAERLRIISSGLVGIGTTNPISIVHAHGASGTVQITSKNVGGNASFYAEASSRNTAKMVLMQAGTSSYDLRTGSADALQMYRDSSELLRIDSSGR